MLDAVELKRCILPPGPRWTEIFHKIFPVEASRQITRRVSSLVSPAVTKTRSPRTIGEERPLPGNEVRQPMFSFADHVSGAEDSRLIPSPRGPRQPGQSSAFVVIVPLAISVSKTKVSRVFT